MNHTDISKDDDKSGSDSEEDSSSQKKHRKHSKKEKKVDVFTYIHVHTLSNSCYPCLDCDERQKRKTRSIKRAKIKVKIRTKRRRGKMRKMMKGAATMITAMTMDKTTILLISQRERNGNAASTKGRVIMTRSSTLYCS